MSSYVSTEDKKYEEQKKDCNAGPMLLTTSRNGKICSPSRHLFERELQRIETGIQQLESKIVSVILLPYVLIFTSFTCTRLTLVSVICFIVDAIYACQGVETKIILFSA